MTDSDRTRLSVSVIDVGTGREQDFHTVMRDLGRLLSEKGYGRMEVVRDEAVPRRFYSVRLWSDARAAERCHGDVRAQDLTSVLYAVGNVTHVVNGVRPRDPLRYDRAWSARAEADRRFGFERRLAMVGRTEGERRGRDRRLGVRRSHEGAPTLDVVGAARCAREQAQAAFSHFKVGAAIETAAGVIVTGCNIENATYGLTICAERVAMFKALSEGHRSFVRVAVVADTETPTPPCGACRQILWEFGGDLEVRLANLTELRGVYKLAELLPLPFDARLL